MLDEIETILQKQKWTEYNITSEVDNKQTTIEVKINHIGCFKTCSNSFSESLSKTILKINDFIHKDDKNFVMSPLDEEILYSEKTIVYNGIIETFYGNKGTIKKFLIEHELAIKSFPIGKNAIAFAGLKIKDIKKEDLYILKSVYRKNNISEFELCLLKQEKNKKDLRLCLKK
jgi:hypothetical protein